MRWREVRRGRCSLRVKDDVDAENVLEVPSKRDVALDVFGRKRRWDRARCADRQFEALHAEIANHGREK